MGEKNPPRKVGKRQATALPGQCAGSRNECDRGRPPANNFPRGDHRRGAGPVLALAIAVTGAGAPGAAVANGAAPAPRPAEEITVVGGREEARKTAGSAHFIDNEELKKFNYADIQRIVSAAPGVSLQQEDGYGLRPNISIRGVAAERSARITLLEDNVLVAPAPYAAPAAYYFPTAGRMHALEILKGPAAITQGPYTIGGALNLVSTPIPEEAAGMVMAEGGEDAAYRVHAHYGGSFANGVGFLLETHQWHSNGYQDIDNSAADTGLRLEDYTLKLRYAPAASRHQLEFKFQYADQGSEQSYLGLTDADFRKDAYRRYGVSQLDNIATEHFQYILRYSLALTDALTASATGYRNEHQRNWFKTEGLDPDGSDSAENFERTSWFNVIGAVNRGEALGGLSTARLQGVLDGAEDTLPGSIQLRSNAREYVSQGVQLTLRWEGETGALRHDLEAGVRYHEDEEDRLQRNSTYHQENGNLVLDDQGLLGNAGNRLQKARATALYVRDRIEWGDWTFSPGLRYENIKQKRTRWADRGAAAAARIAVRDRRDNSIGVWLPGMGVLYRLGADWTMLAGAHKGFTAPGNDPNAREEEALNYELGIRYARNGKRGEIIGFLSDYDNLLGVCTASSGIDCEAGDAFSGDGATVVGVELLLAAKFAPRKGYRLPLSLSYTFTDARFDSDINDTDFFGDVQKGDPIPYIPAHQLHLSAGIERARWSVYLGANYADAVCVRASCERFERTDDALTVDLHGSFRINDRVTAFARIENVTAAENILGRHPYGARPGKDRTAAVGVRLEFQGSRRTIAGMINR